MTVALIVRCHNEEAHIGRLLTGVMHQTVRPDQIVIVDSGSTDATLAIASAFPVEIVTIPPEEFSFGRALNTGLRATHADIVAFASAHVYPIYDTWIEHLTQPFDGEFVALSYGRQEAPPEGRFSEARLLESWFPRQSVARQDHPFCNNANAAIRRTVWEQLPYDEQLTGLEDVDWAKRALEAGYTVSYVAEAPIVHVHDESFSKILNRYRREAIAHKQIYNEQRMHLGEAVRLTAANIAGDLRAARASGALTEHWLEISKFRSAQFLGTYRGFRQQGPVPDTLRRRFFYPSDDGPAPTEPPAGPGNVIDYEAPLSS